MQAEDVVCEPEVMDSEDPLFLLYTSGSTGKPKALVHTQAGYLLYAALTHRVKLTLSYNSVTALNLPSAVKGKKKTAVILICTQSNILQSTSLLSFHFLINIPLLPLTFCCTSRP